MALNYQRNSYKLWESAKRTYEDEETRFVFDPNIAADKPFDEIRQALTKYKVALQPQKQTEIWIKLCGTFVNLFNGDIRRFFISLEYDVNKIRDFVQIQHKKDFPYLSGSKICNYWLYVMSQYADVHYVNMECLTIAPDTHVVQASLNLGIISDDELGNPDVQNIVANKWRDLLKGTRYIPIDIHTPLWLWSRNGFAEIT